MAGQGDKATFTVELKDQASKSADQAASGLERLKNKIRAEEAQLRQLQAAMKRLQGGTSINVQTHKDLQSRIDNAKNSISKSQAKFLEMGGTFDKLKEKTKPLKDKIKETKDETLHFGEAIKKTGGPLGNWSTQLGTLGELLASPEGLLAGLAALTLGVIVGVAALTAYGVAVADTARSIRLLQEAYTGSAANADALSAHISLLSSNLPIARQELEKIAQTLAGEGLGGNALVAALSAVGTETAVLGSSAGSKIQAIAAQAVRTRRLIIGMFDLQGTGVSIDDVAKHLAKSMGVSLQTAKGALQQGRVEIETGLKALDAAVKERFGAIAEKQALALPNQIQKAKEAFAAFFGGLKIDPLLEALASVLHLLDQNTTSGKAIKQIFETILQPLIDQAAALGPVMKGFVIGMILGAQYITMAWLEVSIALKKAIPPSLRPSLDGVNDGVKIGVIVVGALAGAFLALALAAALCIAIGLLPFVIIGALIYGVFKLIGLAIDALKAKFHEMSAFMKALVPEWTGIGTNLANGLAEGLKNGTPAVSAAVHGIADDAIAQARKKFNLHSPSIVMRDMGVNVARGLALGIADGGDEVEASTSGMIHIPSESAATAAGAEAGSKLGGKGATINIHNGAIVIQAKDADEINSEGFLRKLISELSTAISTGGMAPEGA